MVCYPVRGLKSENGGKIVVVAGKRSRKAGH